MEEKMYNYLIKLTEKDNIRDISANETYALITDYYNTLSNNGQVISGYEIYADDYSIYLAVVSPMEDSLSEKYSNNYVKEWFRKIQEVFDVEFVCEGENMEYSSSCQCCKPSWYLIYDRENEGESPLVCGDCMNPVPLYLVPYLFNDKEHLTILSWFNAKEAMDTLWIYGLWDKFTYREKVYHNSKLNREGRKISKELERVLKAPVYYYIRYICEPYDMDSSCIPECFTREFPEVCPICKSEWTTESKFNKCKKCRLITDSLQSKKDQNN